MDSDELVETPVNGNYAVNFRKVRQLRCPPLFPILFQYFRLYAVVFTAHVCFSIDIPWNIENVAQTGGVVWQNGGKVVDLVRRIYIDKVVETKFGNAAGRLFRIIRQYRTMEAKQVCQCTTP